MNKKFCFLLVVLCLSAASYLNAQFRLSSLVSDGMVLQQQTNVRLWGAADAGKEIKVVASWDAQKSYAARTDRDGRWVITLPTPEASFTPWEISFFDGKKPLLTIKDVLVGEVWLAGGQSNIIVE